MKAKFLNKNKLVLIIWIIGLLVQSPVLAQPIINPPDYMTPAWDQVLQGNARFIVLPNIASAAVLDRETGLVWQLAPSSPILTWPNAVLFCSNLTVGTRKGWRLPTIWELTSLVDTSVTTAPLLPIGNPFIGVQPGGYWSATTSANLLANAYFLQFQSGTVGTNGKSGTAFVWCVRGAGGLDPQPVQ